MKPPAVKKIKKEFFEHGNVRIDNYYWLNQRDNPEVIHYLDAENLYTEKILEHTKNFRQKLFDEMVSRIKQEDETVPYPDNGYYYYSRFEYGKEYPVYCRKKIGAEDKEEILLNVNEMAAGSNFYQVTGLAVNPANNILAFGVDSIGRRIYDIYFKDLNTGKLFADKINETTGSAVWAGDNRTIFYSKKDRSLRAYKIFKHTLNTDANYDKELFHEKDNTFAAHVFKTKSKKYIMIGSYNTVSTEFRYLSADNPEGEFEIIQPREKGHEYYVDHGNGKFFIITNWNAKNFRLMSFSGRNSKKENWVEVIAHRKDTFLESIEIFKSFLSYQREMED